MSFSRVTMAVGMYHEQTNSLDGGAINVWSPRHDGGRPEAGREAVISSHGRPVLRGSSRRPPRDPKGFWYAIDDDNVKPIVMDVITIASPRNLLPMRETSHFPFGHKEEAPPAFYPQPTLSAVIRALRGRGYNYSRIHCAFCRNNAPDAPVAGIQVRQLHGSTIFALPWRIAKWR
jgi:hypothetical protein